MALALRIDSVAANAGSIQVFYTFGTAPLPSEPSGMASVFTNKAAVVEAKNSAINHFVAEQVLKMAFAIYAIASNDAQMNNAASILPGKTLTIDPTQAGAVMSYA